MELDGEFVYRRVLVPRPQLLGDLGLRADCERHTRESEVGQVTHCARFGHEGHEGSAPTMVEPQPLTQTLVSLGPRLIGRIGDEDGYRIRHEVDLIRILAGSAKGVDELLV